MLVLILSYAKYLLPARASSLTAAGAIFQDSLEFDPDDPRLCSCGSCSYVNVGKGGTKPA